MYSYAKNDKYFNRDLSWIEFNRRVLREAQNTNLHVLERLQFLSIVSKNFDEFFMVRVASLQHEAKNDNFSEFTLLPSEQLPVIYEEYNNITREQLNIYHNEIAQEFHKLNIEYTNLQNISAKEREFLHGIFMREIYPVLSPLHLRDTGLHAGKAHLHIAFHLYCNNPKSRQEEEGRTDRNIVSILQIPNSIERIHKLPFDGRQHQFTLIEDLIRLFAGELFPNCTIISSMLFHITRSAEVLVDESRQDDFVEAMEEILSERRVSEITRCNIEHSRDALLKKIFQNNESQSVEASILPHPIDLAGFSEIGRILGISYIPTRRQKAVDAFFESAAETIWDWIRVEDRLLCLPFESFSPILKLLDDAADDKHVLSIKITLYRTSKQSPVIAALERAARNGKQVTVIFELKARFDEEQNIHWAESLEDAGAIVIYGIERLKIHAKTLLIIRREPQGIRKYLQISTGNFNEITARYYSDICYFTSKEHLCYEASVFFNAITGYSYPPVLKELILAPFSLRTKFLGLIQREIDKHSTENPSFIRAKLNSLTDIQIIDALYRASMAGVHIELNIRGICMLRAGIAGLSENIQVTSTIGEYLEHSRLYYFYNASDSEIYISSADWMERNLDRRVEILIAIREAKLKQKLSKLLDIYFSSDSHVLQSDGRYNFIQVHENTSTSAQDRMHSFVRQDHEMDSTQELFKVRRKHRVLASADSSQGESTA